MRLGTKFLLAFLLLFGLRSEAQLTLSIGSIQDIGTAIQVQLNLGGLTETYYSCQIATNLTTFYQSNYTAQAYWLVNIPYNSTWAFRLQSINGASIDPAVPPSNTNTIYGDTPPDLVTITAQSTTQIKLSWRNNSSFETGFLVQQDTNANFSTPSYFSVPGVAQSPPQIQTNWIQTFSFAPNVTYFYRISATNSTGCTNIATPNLYGKTLYAPFGSYVSIAPNKTPNPSSLFESATTDVAGQVINTWFTGGGSINNWLLQMAIGTPSTWTTVAAPTDDPVNGMGFTTNGLTAGQTYYWRVAATNGAGFSTWLTNIVYMPIPSTPSSGNAYYVDPKASTNGSTWAGTNWATAVPNMSSIPWAYLSPGNYIWVAQGNYGEFVTARTPGTGTPVTIHAATNYPGGSGISFFSGFYLYRNNTTINGALNDNYAASNYTGPIPSLYAITNNIGFKIASTNVSITQGVFSGTSSKTNNVLWSEIGPVGVWVPQLGEIDITAAKWNGSPCTGSGIAYCYMHDILGTPVALTGGATNFGDVSVHHIIVERAHCNYVVTGYGGDLYNSYLLSTDLVPQIGHPDGIQPSAGWNRIHHNWFKDCFGGRLTYMEMFLSNTVPNIGIYDNLYTFDSQAPAEAIDFTTEPTSFGVGFLTNMYVTNVVIANNTFVGLNTTVNARKTDVVNLYLKNWLVENNIFYGTGTFPYVTLGTPSDTGNFNTPIYANSDVVFDFNAIQNGLVNYNSNVTTVAQLPAPYTHNYTNPFGFVNLGEFHLTNNIQGTNLSSLVSTWPAIDTDLEGITRTNWTVGCFDRIGTSAMTNDPNLILWYRFSGIGNDKNLIHDDSFNHAAAFRYDLFHFPTNSMGPNTNFPNASQWYQFTSSNATFFGEGQYAAIVYTNILDGMTAATFSCWNSNTISPDGTLGSVHNSVLMAAGGEMDQSIPGDWYWGRWSDGNTHLLIRTNVSTTYYFALTWPDTTTNGATPWHHYAWTFDGTQFIGYFDGQPFQTNSAQGVTKLRVGGQGWAGLSCWPHNGTYWWNGPPNAGVAGLRTELYDYSKLDDAYPNAGWMNGAIADMRGYSRVLTASQIQQLASGGSSGPQDPLITLSPNSQTVTAPATATFTSTASSTNALSYQWYRNGTTIAGATLTTYTTPATSSANNGDQYYMIATAGGRTAQSATATLTVKTDPAITTQPQNQTVTAPTTATFSVTATGTAPLTYQWFKNATLITGATASSYTTPATSPADNGAGFYANVTSAAGGPLQSLTAILTVNSSGGSSGGSTKTGGNGTHGRGTH